MTSLANNSYQLGIFENEDYRHKPLMKTMDYINSKYGEKKVIKFKENGR